MKFISESVIESCAEQIGASAQNFEAALVALNDDQPIIAAFVFSENFALFTQAEKELLLFVVLVIHQSIKKERGPMQIVSAEALGKREEKNWETMSKVTAKKFRDRLDVFFENYAQEDLLAFVEDSLTEEEEELVTKVGREPMFVALKSIIDAMCDI
ncbi:MAG: hypothetical protein AAF573_04665 [Bacteroidota bacterium]